MKQQTVIAISGVKNSGKTTLIERLLPELEAHGLAVAVVKHDGHTLEMEDANTDTGRFIAAGAYGTAIFDGASCKVVKRVKAEAHDLIQMFPEADLILIEGLKHSDWPKIEVLRAENSAEPVCAPETLLALVTDRKDAAVYNVPVIALDDIHSVAECILQYMK